MHNVGCSTPSKLRVAMLGSLASSVVLFRLELLKRMVQNGHTVVALAPEDDAAVRARLAESGIAYQTFPLSRTGMNPVEDFATVLALTRYFRQWRPDIVLPYTMKPIIYGNIAARYAGVPCRFALFTGLGYAFSEEHPRGSRAMVRALAVRLYQHSLRGVERAFVYNPAEEEDIRRYRLISEETPITLVPGSGVDTDAFAPTPVPSEPVRFLMIARLLRSKGLEVYCAAAKRLKQRHPDAVVRLLGPYDKNPDAIAPHVIEEWVRDGLIEYLGETLDVRPYIQDASVIVLPAIHREGIPRTILEAMAAARPVITTDVPGCVHAVADRETGLVVPAGDAAALADAMASFVEDPARLSPMGEAGRRLACEKFDVHKVNSLIVREMGLEPVRKPR